MECSCGLTVTDPVPIGLQRDHKDRAVLILFNCLCGSTRAIPIDGAKQHLIDRAHEVDFARRINEGLA